ncbi:MAG: 2-succinyl-5-enolpyruvyl-6-hydroxy-3-cyclohexene-1-carboxylic-acid synthase [Prevotella sp.]
MIYDNEKIRLLTALLHAHGVKQVVACPGSRNAPILNNICEEGRMRCFPVTDERSAGFFALGLSLAQGCSPVAVCVTSGSALLNVAPAVAEAYERHVPLVVVSADRPVEWIGQHVGQTIRQAGAIDLTVRKSVNLVATEQHSGWYLQRLIQEALMAACSGAKGPVHINVPLPNATEMPMVEAHPEDVAEDGSGSASDRSWQKMELLEPAVCDAQVREHVIRPMLAARRPMLLLGHLELGDEGQEMLSRLARRMAVVAEAITWREAPQLPPLLQRLDDGKMPDFVVYMGGSFVCRQLNTRLAEATGTELWRVDADGEVADLFRRTRGVVKVAPEVFIRGLLEQVEAEAHDASSSQEEAAARECACRYADFCRQPVGAEAPEWREQPLEATVAYLEEQLEDMDYDYQVHYANSRAVRWGCRYAYAHKIWCNRGVNGIEGSVSTAVGFAAATTDKVFLVTGDLSFFYDQNALWNRHLGGNLRILLLNDHGGGIFRQVKGLEHCAHLEDIVSASHPADARGICTQNDVGYIHAATFDEMRMGIVRLLTEETSRPMVLEVEMA